MVWCLGHHLSLTVNKYFRGMYIWHSVHYVPSKTSIPFVSKASTSMLLFSIYETFWVLSSRLFRSRIPANATATTLRMRCNCTVGVKRGICGSTRPSATTWTQMLAEKNHQDWFKFSSSSCPPPCSCPHSSVMSVNSRMLRIITSNPIVTTINSAKPNHPSTIAVVPTPLFTLPLPRSCAIVLAATEAVCCQSTETRTKTEATKIRARETWETGREGKGFTSRISEPSSVVSSCQPGKVARRRKQKKARTMATMLGIL